MTGWAVALVVPVVGGLLPAFDWTEEEVEEIREALEAADAWQRFVEEGDDGGRRRFDGSTGK